MKKTTPYLLAIAVLLTTACKKDENTTPNYAESLKGTTWTGTFKTIWTGNDKTGKDKVFVNNPQSRSYTIEMNADNTFNWQDGPNKFKGTWKVVNGSEVFFGFTVGFENKWVNKVNGDKMTIESQPLPDNFRFNNDCVKKPS